jgi:hypothetical protein
MLIIAQAKYLPSTDGGIMMTDMVGDIGTIAGRVYAVLSKSKGPKELEELKRLVNSNEAHYHMAIGWLAREDKLRIDKVNGMTMVTLK